MARWKFNLEVSRVDGKHADSLQQAVKFRVSPSTSAYREVYVIIYILFMCKEIKYVSWQWKP